MKMTTLNDVNEIWDHVGKVLYSYMLGIVIAYAQRKKVRRLFMYIDRIGFPGIDTS